jgi:hypothetical protein
MFYREGNDGCRYHGCSELDHSASLIGAGSQKTGWEKLKKRIAEPSTVKAADD